MSRILKGESEIKQWIMIPLCAVFVLWLVFQLYRKNEGGKAVPLMSEFSMINEAPMGFHSPSVRKTALYGSLLGYFAVRRDDVSVCEEGARDQSSEFCLGTFNEYIVDRYRATGECDKLPDTYHKRFCLILKNQDYAAMNRPENAHLKALVNEDLEELIRRYEIGVPEEGIPSMDRESALITLAFFSGFRHNSMERCQRYAEELSVEKKLACAILFSPRRDVFDVIKNDLAILDAYLSGGEGGMNTCQEIRNETLKRECHLSNIRNIGDLLN